MKRTNPAEELSARAKANAAECVRCAHKFRHFFRGFSRAYFAIATAAFFFAFCSGFLGSFWMVLLWSFLAGWSWRESVACREQASKSWDEWMRLRDEALDLLHALSRLSPLFDEGEKWKP
jgi:hypothetical protein